MVNHAPYAIRVTLGGGTKLVLQPGQRREFPRPATLQHWNPVGRKKNAEGS